MNLEKIKQHWLALSLLLVVVCVFFLLILMPIIGAGIDYHEEKSNLLFKLQRQQKIAARRDLVSQQLETLKQQVQQQSYFSNYDTEALTSADLQNIVKTAVTDAGGQLTSTQGIPGKVENGFTYVAVRVRLTGNIEMLTTILHTIHTAIPLLVVDQIDITPMRGLHSRPNNKPEPSSQLNISFQVVSFMRGVKS